MEFKSWGVSSAGKKGGDAIPLSTAPPLRPPPCHWPSFPAQSWLILNLGLLWASWCDNIVTGTFYIWIWAKNKHTTRNDAKSKGKTELRDDSSSKISSKSLTSSSSSVFFFYSSFFLAFPFLLLFFKKHVLQWQHGMARPVLLNQQVSIGLSGTHGGPGLLSSAINITNIEYWDSAIDYVELYDYKYIHTIVK